VVYCIWQGTGQSLDPAGDCAKIKADARKRPQEEETVESKTRNVWILVIVVLIVACCALAIVVGGVGWFAARSVDLQSFVTSGTTSERVEQTFQVGDAPTLDIDSFAGSITIRSGRVGIIEVTAAKKASNRARLSQIEVQMFQDDSGVRIETRRRGGASNMSVDLDIRVPANTSLVVQTGAGTVYADGITASMDIQSGAGQVDLRAAKGPVRVQVGAGQILYDGAPSGDCRFDTGAGEIRISVPSGWNMQVDLSTGIGAVGIDFPVDGLIRPREVKGVVGDGSQASIQAHTGAGAVTLNQQ
jgi:DUF4097 and DUF4098 domain-containing protein YvlB